MSLRPSHAFVNVDPFHSKNQTTYLDAALTETKLVVHTRMFWSTTKHVHYLTAVRQLLSCAKHLGSRLSAIFIACKLYLSNNRHHCSGIIESY